MESDSSSSDDSALLMSDSDSEFDDDDDDGLMRLLLCAPETRADRTYRVRLVWDEHVQQLEIEKTVTGLQPSSPKQATATSSIGGSKSAKQGKLDEILSKSFVLPSFYRSTFFDRSTKVGRTVLPKFGKIVRRR